MMALLSSRVRRLLEYALCRWESALLISSTAILTALSWFFRYRLPDRTWLGVLIFGLVSEGLLVLSSLFDPASRQQFEDAEEEFPILPPPSLDTLALQQQLNKSLYYYRRIRAAIEKRQNSPFKVQLYDTLRQIGEWLRTIYQLAERLDHYEKEKSVFLQDKARAEQRLRELGCQIQQQENAEMWKSLEETRSAMKEQLRTLEILDDTMKKAQLRLEHTHSTLSTLYSQTLLIDFKDASGNRVAHLQEEVSNEKAVLDAILEAMDEVYRGDRSRVGEGEGGG